MSLVLLNLQSSEEIKLEKENPIIIGRNNVNGCFDKRVSRNHGKITWKLDGKVHLVALHTNPCFFTRKGTPPVLQLIKNEEEFLEEGDCLGLLPDSFWFQIKEINEIKNENNIEQKNKMEFKKEKNKVYESHTESVTEIIKNNNILRKNEVLEKNINSIASSSSLGPNSESLKFDNSESEAKVKSESSQNTSSSSWGLGNPEFEKTRRLPLWMYQIKEPIENNPNIEVTYKSEFLAEHANKKAKLQPGASSLEVKQDSTLEQGIPLDCAQNIYSPNKTSPFKIKTWNKDLDNENCKEENKKKHENPVENVLAQGSVQRPICQYESNCYRKNPQHKLEFCHPGDEDYIPYEERPFCQYGGACYRRNRMHKVEYRHPEVLNTQNVSASSSHSSSPLPASPFLSAKRKRKTLNQETINSEDYDDYDLEDPFINDASSDEYCPSDIDEEEAENLDDTD